MEEMSTYPVHSPVHGPVHSLEPSFYTNPIYILNIASVTGVGKLLLLISISCFNEALVLNVLKCLDG